MSDCSDMEYSSDNECEYDDYYNTGKKLNIHYIIVLNRISYSIIKFI